MSGRTAKNRHRSSRSFDAGTNAHECAQAIGLNRARHLREEAASFCARLLDAAARAEREHARDQAFFAKRTVRSNAPRARWSRARAPRVARAACASRSSAISAAIEIGSGGAAALPGEEGRARGTREARGFGASSFGFVAGTSGASVRSRSGAIVEVGSSVPCSTALGIARAGGRTRAASRAVEGPARCRRGDGSGDHALRRCRTFAATGPTPTWAEPATAAPAADSAGDRRGAAHGRARAGRRGGLRMEHGRARRRGGDPSVEAGADAGSIRVARSRAARRGA